MSHKQLMIVKGIESTPGDNSGSEQKLISIDLLDSGSGFSLAANDGWTPNIPSLKNNGVWADSPTIDGRTLIAGANTNVTETMRLIISTQSTLAFSAAFTALRRMVQDARAFWDTFTQIDPCYLAWWAVGAPGPQYALIYNIDMDFDLGDGEDALATVTLTIEREVGWRGIPPGANPKQWALENVLSQKLNASNASLLTGTDFLFYETNILNRAEQNAGQTAYVTKNFVDIPAASIPGDLPALLCFEYGSSNSTTATALYVAKSTKRNTGNTSRQTGVNEYIVRIFNAADAGMGTDTTLAADTGASLGTSGLQRRSQTTFATATLVRRLTFQGRSIAVIRGTYMAFVRARLSAAANTVQLQLALDELGSASQLIGSPVNFSDDTGAGTGNTTNWGLVYLGIVTIPSNDRRTAVSPNGMGVNVGASSSADVSIGLNASRTAGAGSLYVNDLILIPIDEGAVRLISTGQAITAAANPSAGVLYDNTGYMMHGRAEEYVTLAQQNLTSNWSEYDRLEVRGQPLYLTPGVDNRLEFLAYTESTLRSNIANPAGMTVRLSAVPRWSGIRDK